MNKNELLQMTTKEIEKFLNNNISAITFESEYAEQVKDRMINNVKTLFDKSVEISIPYYTNQIFAINIDNLYITFSVGTKITGKTMEISRLRKKDIKTVGKFKFSDIVISFYNPYFEKNNLENFTVKVSSNFSCTGGASISLKHRKEKLIDMLAKNILTEEIQSQDENWRDIRKTIVLNASQPKIKEELFKPNFNQERWNFILQKTEEVNKELIDNEIEKIFSLIK